MPLEQLAGKPARTYIDDVRSAEIGKGDRDPYSVYRRSRPRSCSTRSPRRTARAPTIATELFKTNVNNGILGTFQIDENGDTTLGTSGQLRPDSRDDEARS